MIYFTPGPSQLFHTVPAHITQALRENIPSLSHRSKKYQLEIFEKTVAGLRTLMDIPSSHQILFVASGTEAMERVIENTVLKHSFHFVNGAFSKRFYTTSLELKKKAEKCEVAFGKGFLFKDAAIPKKSELVCFTQNETSTGISLPLQEIYAIKKKNPDKLIALDIVSSAPYVEVDFRSIDIAFFSVQKGFGLPAGLGVMVVGPQALEKAKNLLKKDLSIGSYHSFLSLAEFAAKNQTPETPNVLGQYLLGKVVGDMRRIGITKIRKQTDQKATLLYDFFDSHNTLSPFVSEKRFRSHTVLTIVTPDGSDGIVERLKEKGFVVDRGYGNLKETQIRIANFPAHNASDVQSLLSHLKY